MMLHNGYFFVSQGREVKKKNMFRLRMAAILLSAAVFSYLAVPSVINNIPDKTVERVSSYIKGEIRFMGDTGDTLKTVGTETDMSVPVTEIQSSTSKSDLITGTETGEGQVVTETTALSDVKTVQAINLSRYEVTDTPRLILMNETGYKVDLGELASQPYQFERPEGTAPLVLVVHTHGTEGYLPDGVDTYDDDTEYRSTDTALNVVSVGNAFCETLESYGIGTIHDVAMYDRDDFNNAYLYSRSAMKKYLSLYPSIKYIVDIHRDTVFNADGENKKPIVYIDGEATAQVMLVIGTDESGSTHKDWRTNLTLAAKLQQKFNEYPTFARPVYLRKASYNQQLCSGAFLLEVGSCGNTVTEARRAAVIAAKQFASLIVDQPISAVR